MHDLHRFVVAPAADFEKRRLLFSSLGRALGVIFVPVSHAAGRNHEGTIVFAPDAVGDPKTIGPTLVIQVPLDGARRTAQRIALSDTTLLDPLLRGAVLSEAQISPPSRIVPDEGDTVLAKVNGQAVWVRKCSRSSLYEVASASVEELSSDEILKDRLSDKKAFDLLIVIHFVRSVLGARGVIPPPPRASFIVDDANVRTFSYGCVHFPKLVKLAQACNFHVTLATIPLDMWWISKSMKEFACKESRWLSLAIHGNNHEYAELNRRMSFERQLALMGQALRRVADFERKKGIPVSRAVVPPHGMCSRGMMGALRVLGFEAIYVSRPASWVSQDKPRVVLDDNVLQRWFPADLVDGMPVIHRQEDTTDFRFNALLGQPMIVYFHHTDFAGGYDKICGMAEKINMLGHVEWHSLGKIARSNYDVRQDGTTLRIRPFSRAIDVPIPGGIARVVVELGGASNALPGTMVLMDGNVMPMTAGDEGKETVPQSVSSGTVVTVLLCEPHAEHVHGIKEPLFRIRPLIRRTLTETRDRIYPLLHRRREG